MNIKEKCPALAKNIFNQLSVDFMQISSSQIPEKTVFMYLKILAYWLRVWIHQFLKDSCEWWAFRWFYYFFKYFTWIFMCLPFPVSYSLVNDWCLIYVFRTLFLSGAALKSHIENRWQVQHNLWSMLSCQRIWVPPPRPTGPCRTTIDVCVCVCVGKSEWVSVQGDVRCAASLVWQLFVSIRLAAWEMCISNGARRSLHMRLS